MDVNLWSVLAATVVMFAFGAFWYSLPFRVAWGRIHGFDKLSKAEQEKLMSEMGPIYAGQLFVTIISAFVLAHFIVELPDVAYWQIAFWLWLGFVMPSQVSAVLFSNTPQHFKLQQIAIMSGEALVRLVLAAWVISLF